MKILMAASYLYNPQWPEFTRNKTGFGIMLKDIVDSVSSEAEVCFISHVITHGHGSVVPRHLWRDVIFNSNPKDWIMGVANFFKYNQSLNNRLRYAYYRIDEGFVRKYIRKFNPDIVHIHGIGQSVVPYIEACTKLGVPYIVTLHGLIGLDDSVHPPIWDKELERKFLIYASDNNIPLTVISSGIKKRIEENYLHHQADNITVVCNGTRIPYSEKIYSLDTINLRQEYGLSDEKIIVAIGSVCERKNQIQIVRAMKNVKASCHVFLCGGDATNGEVQKAIDAAGLNNRIHMTGFLPREIIDQILEQADLNVVASKDEGFGLSIIEAFSHGIPTVTFADLDAVPDLYDERAMLKVESRTDEALADGIEKGLKKNWDKEWIREYSRNFSLEKMAEQYKSEYSQIYEMGGGCPKMKNLEDSHSECSVVNNESTPNLVSIEVEKSIFGQSGGGHCIPCKND